MHHLKILYIAVEKSHLSADYDILKGLLSHWVMIFGTIYLFVFKYIKVEVVNTTKSVFWGLVLFALIGTIINTLFFAFDIPNVNAMYMLLSVSKVAKCLQNCLGRDLHLGFSFRIYGRRVIFICYYL